VRRALRSSGLRLVPQGRAASGRRRGRDANGPAAAGRAHADLRLRPVEKLPRLAADADLRDTQETRPEPFTRPTIFVNFTGQGCSLPGGFGSVQSQDQAVATRHEVAPMPTPGSVTVWIEQLKAGDAAAAAPLWQGYFRRLVGLARQRLGAAPRGVADEEDVALSAFASFCRAAAQGRFPRLDDRDDLWQVPHVPS